MSQDPAPYSTKPQPTIIRIHLAILTDPTEKARVPWQGIVVWTKRGVPLPGVAAAPPWALLSKS